MRVNDLFFWLLGIIMLWSGVKQVKDPHEVLQKRFPGNEVPMETIETTRKIGYVLTVLGILFLVIAVIRLFL